MDKDELQNLICHAEHGDEEACFDLADCYIEGNGVSKSYVKAAEILNKFLKITDKESIAYGYAAERLGDVYLCGGFGLEQNFTKAAFWYKSAEECGVKTACKKLGDMYLNGAGVAQSYAMAEELYRKAAFYYEVWCDGGYDGESYDLSANVALGNMYFNGTGVEKDLPRAFEFFYNAGYGKFYAPAQSRMAYCYYFGSGVKKDEEKAKYWWKKAADSGCENAKTALEKYFEN